MLLVLLRVLWQVFLSLPVLTVVLVAITLLANRGYDPHASAEESRFLNVDLEFLDQYRLPKTRFQDTPVGGLSGLVYDHTRDRYLAISDDRSDLAPARFYTFKLNLTSTNPATIQSVLIENVTLLLAKDGQPYPKDSVDPEGIVITPRQTVMIASEGVARDRIKPFIDEFDLKTGQWRSRLPIPKRFNPRQTQSQRFGVRDNYGFEGLALLSSSPNHSLSQPFQIFAGVESALFQDLPTGVTLEPPSEGQPLPPLPTMPLPARFLHYLVDGDRRSHFSEHVYMLDAPSPGATFHGLTELFALDQSGHFLGLERTFTPDSGLGVKLYQLSTFGATDVSNLGRLPTDLSKIQPIQKRLVLDLGSLGFPLGNLEGIAWGSRLPDGRQSLVMVGDDNFSDQDLTQFLLFRVRAVQR